MAELGTDGVISECNQSSAHFSRLIMEIFALSCQLLQYRNEYRVNLKRNTIFLEEDC